MSLGDLCVSLMGYKTKQYVFKPINLTEMIYIK